MSAPEFGLFLAVGRLFVWLLQVAGPLKPVWKLHPLLVELSECDLCLGFWVYLALACFYAQGFTGLWPWPVEAVILAAVATFTAHLLRLGWLSKFGTVVIN